MRLPALRRRPPAAWAQRSTRPWSTAATSAASARERPADQLGEGRLDVETTGFGLAERRQQRTVRLAGPNRFAARHSVSPEPDEQGVPALCLGQCGQRQVLGREALHALRLVLLAADHFVRRHVGPLVAQHPGQHLSAVIGSPCSSCEVCGSGS